MSTVVPLARKSERTGAAARRARGHHRLAAEKVPEHLPLLLAEHRVVMMARCDAFEAELCRAIAVRGAPRDEQAAAADGAEVMKEAGDDGLVPLPKVGRG